MKQSVSVIYLVLNTQSLSHHFVLNFPRRSDRQAELHNSITSIKNKTCFFFFTHFGFFLRKKPTKELLTKLGFFPEKCGK